VGRLLQALMPQPGDQVLAIGAGTGFLTACLRAIATRVRALEIFPELTDAARQNLTLFGQRDVEVADADAMQGDGGARYDVIALTASLPVYDGRSEGTLTLGGRRLRGGGEQPVMDAGLLRRTSEDSVTVRSLFETVIDPLVNAVRPPEFTFCRAGPARSLTRGKCHESRRDSRSRIARASARCARQGPDRS